MRRLIALVACLHLLFGAAASALAAVTWAPRFERLQSCSWDRPGHNPFTGDVVAAIDRYVDIPTAVRVRLKQRMQAREYDELVDIRRDDIKGREHYEPTIRDMHFGSDRVCRQVTRARWTQRMHERGLVYCEQGHCILVPTVCRNVSRIDRRPALVASAPVADPGTAPLHFAAPSAWPTEAGTDRSAMPRASSSVGEAVAGVVEPGAPAATDGAAAPGLWWLWPAGPSSPWGGAAGGGNGAPARGSLSGNSSGGAGGPGGADIPGGTGGAGGAGDPNGPSGTGGTGSPMGPGGAGGTGGTGGAGGTSGTVGPAGPGGPSGPSGPGDTSGTGGNGGNGGTGATGATGGTSGTAGSGETGESGGGAGAGGGPGGGFPDGTGGLGLPGATGGDGGGTSGGGDPAVASVPEPATWGGLLIGLFALALVSARRRLSFRPTQR